MKCSKQIEFHTTANLPEEKAKEFIDNLDTERVKQFMLNDEKTGYEEIDLLLEDSGEDLYYLLEQKIELLRKDKKFNVFYENFYGENIENMKQEIIELLRSK